MRYYLTFATVDCVWDIWDQWGTCSAECGTGTRVRTRVIKIQEENGGAVCTGLSEESEDCNTHDCPASPGWGTFGPWSSCTSGR